MSQDFRFSSQTLEAGVPFWFFCENASENSTCKNLQVEISKMKDQNKDLKFKANLTSVPNGKENLWGLEMSIPESGTYEVLAGTYRSQFEIKPSSTLSFGFEFGMVASAVFAVLLILFVWMKRRTNPYKRLS